MVDMDIIGVLELEDAMGMDAEDDDDMSMMLVKWIDCY